MATEKNKNIGKVIAFSMLLMFVTASFAVVTTGPAAAKVKAGDLCEAKYPHFKIWGISGSSKLTFVYSPGLYAHNDLMLNSLAMNKAAKKFRTDSGIKISDASIEKRTKNARNSADYYRESKTATITYKQLSK